MELRGMFQCSAQWTDYRTSKPKDDRLLLYFATGEKEPTARPWLLHCMTRISMEAITKPFHLPCPIIDWNFLYLNHSIISTLIERGSIPHNARKLNRRIEPNYGPTKWWFSCRVACLRKRNNIALRACMRFVSFPGEPNDWLIHSPPNQIRKKEHRYDMAWLCLKRTEPKQYNGEWNVFSTAVPGLGPCPCPS